MQSASDPVPNPKPQAGSSDNVKSALDAFLANPVGFTALTAVLAGGLAVYYTLVGDISSFRKDFASTVERAQTRNSGQDGEISELKARIARTEGAFEGLRRDIQDMRSDVREITTNMRWLTRDRTELPIPLDRKSQP